MHSVFYAYRGVNQLLCTVVLFIVFAGSNAAAVLRPDPGDTSMTLGQFAIKAAQAEIPFGSKPEMIAETSTFDESPSFRHWQVYFFSSCASCKSEKEHILNFLGDFKNYCMSRGGQWMVSNSSSPSGTCSGASPFEVRVSTYSKPDQLIMNNRHYFLFADAFERKEGATGDLSEEYRPEVTTRPSNNHGFFGKSSDTLRFQMAYVKRNLAAEKMAVEAETQRRAEEQKARQAEESTRQAVAEATYLPKTKTIGQQICRIYKAQESH